MATRAHPTGQIFVSIIFAFIAIVSYPLPSHSKSAGEVLSDYNRLPEKDREAKILEGAKREAKMVYYGTTAVDHVQRVFAEFKKKYPFMEVADYRSGSVNVFNKIATEARAKRYEVDVIDLEPGEVYGIANECNSVLSRRANQDWTALRRI
jgi:iron(III) transport system substrate-binding protein